MNRTYAMHDITIHGGIHKRLTYVQNFKFIRMETPFFFHPKKHKKRQRKPLTTKLDYGNIFL